MTSVQGNNYLQQAKTFALNTASFAAGSLGANIVLATCGIGTVGNLPSIVTTVGAFYHGKGSGDDDSLKKGAAYGALVSTAVQLGGCFASLPVIGMSDPGPYYDQALTLNKIIFVAGLCLIPAVIGEKRCGRAKKNRVGVG